MPTINQLVRKNRKDKVRKSYKIEKNILYFWLIITLKPKIQIGINS